MNFLFAGYSLHVYKKLALCGMFSQLAMQHNVEWEYRIGAPISVLHCIVQCTVFT